MDSLLTDGSVPQKACFKCARTLPLTQFYRHQMMGDGHLGKCKECTKADVREHRERNSEKLRAYDRTRSKLTARRAFLDSRKDRKRKEVLAMVTVHNHTKRGKLQKQPCVVCGEVRADAHHENYDRPLDVVWLCRTHHARRHAELAGKSDHGVWRAIGAAPVEVVT